MIMGLFLTGENVVPESAYEGETSTSGQRNANIRFTKDFSSNGLHAASVWIACSFLSQSARGCACNNGFFIIRFTTPATSVHTTSSTFTIHAPWSTVWTLWCFWIQSECNLIADNWITQTKPDTHIK